MWMKAKSISALSAIVMFAAACAGSGAQATGNNGPIVIGMPIGLSGFVTFLDGPWNVGAELAVDDINAQGGVLGRKLTIVTADAKSDPAQSGNAAQQVIDKGAQFILPTVDYDFGGPAARVAQQHSLISMTLAGDTRFGATGIGPLAFNIDSGGPTEGASAAQFAHDKGWQHPYLLEDTSLGYSTSFCANFRLAWAQIAGVSTGSIPVDQFTNSDTSIASQITRLKAANPQPDFIVLCSYPPGGATADKQLRAAGISVPVVGGVAFDGTFWLGAVPNENNFFEMGGGLISGTDPNPERAKVFSEFTTKTGKPPVNGIWALAGYSSVQALALAIKAAGSTQSDAVAAQLEKFKNQPLAIGPTTWTPSCHVAVGRPTVVIKMVNGAEQYVTDVTPSYIPQSVC